VFRTRALDHLAMPYLDLDATYVKARHSHHIVSRGLSLPSPRNRAGTSVVRASECRDAAVDPAAGRGAAWRRTAQAAIMSALRSRHDSRHQPVSDRRRRFRAH